MDEAEVEVESDDYECLHCQNDGSLSKILVAIVSETWKGFTILVIDIVQVTY